jgi:repressor LexA
MYTEEWQGGFAETALLFYLFRSAFGIILLHQQSFGGKCAEHDTGDAGCWLKICVDCADLSDTVHVNGMQLTERQQQILDFIEENQRSRGVAPSTREIQEHFGFSSQTTVMDHLHALKQKGAIQQEKGKARSLVVPATINRPPTIDIPIYGTIPAGLPADQQQEDNGCITVDIESLKIPRNARTFALKIRGDSMINAGINEGDTVILEFREPRNKDIVAALVDGETTLKRYVVQHGKPFLRAENPRYPDLIPAQELVIQGVMIALFRVVK